MATTEPLRDDGAPLTNVFIILLALDPLQNIAIWFVFQPYVYQDNIAEPSDSFIYCLPQKFGISIFYSIGNNFFQASKNHPTNMLACLPKPLPGC